MLDHSVMFSRQEYWNGLPFPSQGDLPDPGMEPTSLASPALAGGFITTGPIWVQIFVTAWTAAHQASLSFTLSLSLLKLVSIESVVPYSHLILCLLLLLLPSVFPRIRIFSHESTLRMRWPKYWSFSFSISPSNEYSGLISFRSDCLTSLLSKGLSKLFCKTTVQKHQIFSAEPFLWSNSHIQV